MADTRRSKDKRSSGNNSAGGGVRYIDVGLSADDKARLAQAEWSFESVFDNLSDCVAAGLKAGIRHDERNHTFVASLTDASGSEVRVLSGRGSTAINAVLSLLFKHYTILGGDWSSASGVGTTYSDFD
jgi:hypothetical protein